MMRTSKLLFVFIPLLVLTTACDTVREQFAAPNAPDEFAVMRRAPLERPPEVFNTANELPVPSRGKARPQELAPVKAAEQALIGEEVSVSKVDYKTNAGLTELLNKSGAGQADPSIRHTIEKEHMELLVKEQPTIDRIIGKVTNKAPGASIVDSKAEFERLKANREAGKSVTEGETPTIKLD